jgi:hypothetical protein
MVKSVNIYDELNVKNINPDVEAKHKSERNKFQNIKSSERKKRCSIRMQK